MTGTRPRSASPAPAKGSSSSPKRVKKTHVSSTSNSDVTTDPTPYFAPDVLHPNSIHKLNHEYATSEPYKYCKIDKLFQDDLLVGVKDEILSELSFTEKETDIYKVCRSLVLCVIPNAHHYCTIGQPDWRSRFSELFDRRPACSLPQPAQTSRRTLLLEVPLITSSCDRLWSPLRLEARHVGQHLHKRLSPPQSRRRYRNPPRLVHSIYASSALPGLAARVGRCPRALPHQAWTRWCT
jgi:hypothetical protein